MCINFIIYVYMYYIFCITFMHIYFFIVLNLLYFSFSLTHLDLTISVFKNCILKNAMFFFLTIDYNFCFC